MNCLEESSKSEVKQENLSEPVVATKKEPKTEPTEPVNDQPKKKEDDGAMLFVKNLNFKTGKFPYYNYSVTAMTVIIWPISSMIIVKLISQITFLHRVPSG